MINRYFILMVLAITFAKIGPGKAELMVLSSNLPEYSFVLGDMIINSLDGDDEDFCGALQNNASLPLKLPVWVNYPLLGSEVRVKKAIGLYVLLEENPVDRQEDINLRKALFPATYPRQEWEEYLNDSIKAVLISGDSVVKLYEHSNFTGASLVIDGKQLKEKGYNCYTGLKWGDNSSDFCCVDLQGTALYEKVSAISILPGN